MDKIKAKTNLGAILLGEVSKKALNRCSECILVSLELCGGRNVGHDEAHAQCVQLVLHWLQQLSHLTSMPMLGNSVHKTLGLRQLVLKVRQFIDPVHQTELTLLVQLIQFFQK